MKKLKETINKYERQFVIVEIKPKSDTSNCWYHNIGNKDKTFRVTESQNEFFDDH